MGIRPPPPPPRSADLNRISEALMDELVANDLDSFVLLKNDKIAKWWGDVLRARKVNSSREALLEAENATRITHKRLAEIEIKNSTIASTFANVSKWVNRLPK